MPIEDDLQSEKEMCVKNEWEQFLKAQTQDYFIEMEFLEEIVGFIPFLHSKQSWHIGTKFSRKLIVLTKISYIITEITKGLDLKPQIHNLEIPHKLFVILQLHDKDMKVWWI